MKKASIIVHTKNMDTFTAQMRGVANARAFSVFMYLYSGTVRNSITRILRISDLAKSLNMSPVTLRRCLKRLCEVDAIHSVPWCRGIVFLLVNPNITWNGKMKDRKEAIVRWGEFRAKTK